MNSVGTGPQSLPRVWKLVTFAMTWREKKGASGRSSTDPDMSRTILQQDSKRHNKPQDAGVVPVALPRILGERRVAGQQPRTVTIKNLWAIVQEETNKVAPVTSEPDWKKNPSIALEVSAEPL